MNVTFSKKNDKWVGTVAVSGPFNIHMANEGYYVGVAVSTQSEPTEFAEVFSFKPTQPVIDDDYNGYVFPKTVKVECFGRVLGENPPTCTITVAPTVIADDTGEEEDVPEDEDDDDANL